jgi:dihydrofolate synthase / folylpolyglutamate synthase
MDSIEYLFSLEKLGIKFGLENIRTICAALGNPQDCCRSVIVAGTNGKGSVVAIADAALRLSGVRTGRYTSPHLVRLEERFAVGGQPVATSRLREAAGEVRLLVERLQAERRLAASPTFFEVTTAVGFDLFRRAGVELMVLEVGLGGRLDATNVADAMAAAVTTIDLDHERLLGATIPEIAAEKAGVIKPGMTVVVGERRPEAYGVFERVCRDRGARLLPAYEGVETSAGVAGGETTLRLTTPSGSYGPLRLGLRGRHQVHNAVVAVRLIEALGPLGFAVTGEAIERALEETRWPGRLDLVRLPEGRQALLDAAHNPAGARVLADYIGHSYPSGLPIVFGAMHDKNAAGMLEALLPHATAAVFTEAENPRARAAADLAALARTIVPALRIESRPRPLEALDLAWTFGPTVCVAGSIFLVGDVLRGIRPGPDF